VSDHIPVLIVTYARPQGLKNLLELSVNSGVKNFYVAIDGPKNSQVRNLQSEMLEIISNFERLNSVKVNLWAREENLGAAVSVVTAIDWFFNNESMGIVLEDDLLPSPDFYTFASSGLNFYQDDRSVWMISGSRMNPETTNFASNDWSFYPMIWGWAGWRYKWLEMRQVFEEKDEKRLSKVLNRRYNFWFIGSSRAKKGVIDAWDVPLAFAQWSRRKMSVIPPVNLVTNVGFDTHATHTSGTNFPLNHPTSKLSPLFTFEHQPTSGSVQSYDAILERSLFRIRPHHMLLQFYGPVLNRIGKRNKNLGPLKSRLAKVSIPN
jgi:hypothetical protein